MDRAGVFLNIMHRRNIFILLVFTAVSIKTFGQTTRSHGVFWGRLILADRINDRWKWELFLQKRTQNIPHEKNIFGALHYNSFLIWTNYCINKNLKLYLSPLGYFDSYPFLSEPEDIDLPGIKEFRFSARLEHELKGKHVDFSSRFTTECRRRDINQNDVYIPNWRLRYMTRFEKPVIGILQNNKPVSFFISDEVLVQFGKAVKNNASMFDQNRAAAGFSLEVVKNIKASFSYLNIFQQRANGKDFDDAHALWAVVTFDNLFSQFKRP
ncbi:hypothetical protein A4R26_08520 [Niastella populi]|uniref:DUF2490 domain-containing protein n=2 Tax=Niastella populi TaxID=550983 RepID=A0A1V9ELJ8_9BACT|nr:hypothetical protein A4R26_08520 [Niastella populi]